MFNIFKKDNSEPAKVAQEKVQEQIHNSEQTSGKTGIFARLKQAYPKPEINLPQDWRILF